MTRIALALLALVLMSDAAAAKLPCLSKSQAMERGDSPRYREVDGRKCWYVGKRTPKKSEFVIKPVKPAKSSSGVGKSKAEHATAMAVRRQPTGDRVADIVGVAPGPLETLSARDVVGQSANVAAPRAETIHAGEAVGSSTVTVNSDAPIASPNVADMRAYRRRGGPAPEQARLAHAFQSITPTTWRTHIDSLSALGIYRLEYRREFPAVWAMASRWP